MFESVKQFWLKWRSAIVAGLVCLAVGTAGGRLLTPVKIKTETITVEKIVEKKVEQKVAVVDHSVKKTVIKRLPDGSSETTIVARNDIDTQASTKQDVVVATKIEDKKSQTTAPSATSVPNWSAGVGARFHFQDNLLPIYQLALGYRLFGPFWGEVTGGQDLSVSATAKMEF